MNLRIENHVQLWIRQSLFLASLAKFLTIAIPMLGWANEAWSQQTMVATPTNLARFEFSAPAMTHEEAEEVAAAESQEADIERQLALYAEAEPVERGWSFYDMEGGGNESVEVEIYQNPKSVGKQFLLARQNGTIRYVFAITAGRSTRSTPAGRYQVTHQKWRHMSTKYPSRIENNMDHVSYFYPAIGFHSTVMGSYRGLGRRGSHGCIRLARPQARAMFSLIKRANRTDIYSYRSEEPPVGELPLIKEMLAKDLNFIQQMINSRNKGDVPFKSWDEYDMFSRGKLTFNNIELQRLLKAWRIPALLEIPRDHDLSYSSTQMLTSL